MKISDEAVEAAVKAIGIHRFPARAALEAAAPIMLAEALAEVERLRAQVARVRTAVAVMDENHRSAGLLEPGATSADADAIRAALTIEKGTDQ